MSYATRTRALASILRRRSAARLAGLAALAAAAILALALLAPSAPAAAQGDDRAGVRSCISIDRIDRTEVIDEDTILFHMHGNEVYENQLPRSCPELRSEQRFMYRVSTSMLCDVDVITVLNDAGFGFLPGASCGLGKFAPLSAEAAEQLSAEGRARRRR